MITSSQMPYHYVYVEQPKQKSLHNINTFLFQTLCLSLDRFQIERRKLFKKMHLMNHQWILSFEIKPNGNRSNVYNPNIVHVTQHSSTQYIPFIRFYSFTLRLYICMYLEGNNCFLDENPLPTTYFSNIKIMQTWNVKTLKYVYSIYVNDELKHSVTNNRPRTYTNVRLYASNPWHVKADATLRNLVFENIPNGMLNLF